MIRFDELLVAPLPWMLLRAVRRAEAAVGSEPERLVGSSHNLARQGIQIRIDSEGELAWSNFHDTSTSASVSREVRLVWWSDYLGNRHIRVLGILREGAYARHWSHPSERMPPLLRIYPDAGFEVSGPGIEPGLLVVCPCGATGTPHEIAWMGHECGPCHDRREGGELPVRPWDGWHRHFLLESSEEEWSGVRGFQPDSGLVLEDSRGTFTWDMASGRVSFAMDLDHNGLEGLKEVRTSANTIHSEQIHDLPDGKLLAVGDRGRLQILESFTRLVLIERQIQDHFDWQPRTLVEGEGTVLLAVDGGQDQLVFVSLPDLKHVRILKPGTLPFGELQAQNDRWLAVCWDNRVRVIPWPPLVEWFTRCRTQEVI